VLLQAILLSGLFGVGPDADQVLASQAGGPIQLVGRLLDEDLQPIRGAEVKVSDWSFEAKGTTETTIRFREVPVTTDQEGRFSHAWPRMAEGLTVLKRSTHLRKDVEHPRSLRAVQFAWEGLESFEVEFPKDLTEVPVDLGDIQLVRPGSIRWLAPKDDAELEVEYRRAVAAREHYLDHARAVETCLTEIVRRKGEHWEAFLTTELARERAKILPSSIHDLALLTALRRVQGKPDPLAIKLAGPPELECRIGEALKVSVQLRNVDADGEAFQFTFGPRFDGDRLPIDSAERFAMEVLDASGERIPSIPIEPLSGSIPFEQGSFEQALELHFELSLDSYVHWPGAGEFQARIHFHEVDEIAMASDPFGWITSTSPWFIVHAFGQQAK
jgi:hypothetical protein